MRTLFVTLLSFAFVSTCLAIIPPLDDLLRGDANNDGQVNFTDDVYIQNFLYSGGDMPPCLEAADVNDDGSIDLSDSVYLNSYLFLGGSAPPAPFPYCGQDPDPGSLTCDDSACP